MIGYYTNLGLLDHAVERCLSLNNIERLVIFLPRTNKYIEEDVKIKLNRLVNLKVDIVVHKNFVIDSFKFYKILRKLDTIYFDDFSGKDWLAILLLFRRTKILFLHDVNPHLGERRTFDLLKPLFYFCFKRIHLCSNFSYLIFNSGYKFLKSKTTLSPLPIYEYSIYGFSDPRIVLPEKYVLIFGRISIYKGIENFLQNYDHSLPIIIVGRGYRIDHYNVTQVNDFVPVSELNTYIVKSSIVILPYLEATQSGVLSVLRGFPNVRVAIREIPAFKGTETSANWFFYKDNELSDLLNS